MSELERAKFPRQIIGAVLLGAFAYVLGLFPPHNVLGLYPLSFGVGVAAGVLFGFWGVLAVYISHVLIFLSSMGSELSVLVSLAPLVQALIPAWAFRQFKVDPRIKTMRDVVIFSVSGVVLSSLASTLIGPTAMFFYGVIPNQDALLYIVMPRWLLSASILTLLPLSLLILTLLANVWGLFLTLFTGLPLLLLGSRITIKNKAYCKGWFS